MELGIEVLVLLAGVAYLVYYFATLNHDYWKKRGVVTPKFEYFFGSHRGLVLSTVSFSELSRRFYEMFPGERYIGLLIGWTPFLMVRDLNLIQQILTKDFEYFPDRALPHDEKNDPISGNLLFIEGVRWRNLRIKLSPTFSSGKIKRMFPLMLESSEELVSVLEGHAAREEVVQMKDFMGRFSTDIIGNCAFGINCNSLKNPDAEFRQQGMGFFDTRLFNKVRQGVLNTFPRSKLLHYIFRTRSLYKFMLGVMRETVQYREKNNVKRNDFLDLLIEIKNKGKIVDDKVDTIEDPYLHVPISTSSDELKFTENLMVAQAFVFFAAGFETSSSAMSFCLLELSHNLDIQHKVRADIDAAIRKNGGLTYEALSDMTYLDKVVSETLRKYPAGAHLPRMCVKPYRVPGSDLVLQPGTRVLVPVTGIHYDPDIYPDPERFDPERFSPEAKAARHHYAYLPFGEGPRICIPVKNGYIY